MKELYEKEASVDYMAVAGIPIRSAVILDDRRSCQSRQGRNEQSLTRQQAPIPDTADALFPTTSISGARLAIRITLWAKAKNRTPRA